MAGCPKCGARSFPCSSVDPLRQGRTLDRSHSGAREAWLATSMCERAANGEHRITVVVRCWECCAERHMPEEIEEMVMDWLADQPEPEAARDV